MHICIDPLVWYFANLSIITSLGKVLAFVDELAAVLQKLRRLHKMFYLFELFRRISVGVLSSFSAAF